MGSSSIPLKTCIDCLETLPVTRFYENSSYADGYTRTCKACTAIRRGRTPPFEELAPSGFRTCRTCGEIYPETFEYFYHSKNGELGLASRCRTCQKNSIQLYVDQHPDRRIESARRCDAKRAEKRKQYHREHAKERSDYDRRYYAEHGDRIRAKVLIYRRENPEKRRVNKNARRARQLALPNNFTADDWRRALEYFSDACAICGRPAGLWHVLAQEHWIALKDPRTDNPGTVAGNILPICHSTKDGQGGCNNLKSNKDPVVWLQERYGKRKAKVILKRIETYFEWVRNQSDEH